MSNPQLEDGYTRIANELLEAIYRQELNGLQIRILLLFIRQSYGYSKKTASVSGDYVQKCIGTNKRHAQKVIKSLVDERILVVESEATFSKPRTFSINKKWEEWGATATQRYKSNTAVQTVHNTEVQTVHNTEVQLHHHKRKIKKKNKENIYEPFFENLWQNYPKKRGKTAVSQKAKKELFEAGTDLIMAAIENYAKESNGLEDKYILHGSTFFNGRWKDYVPAATPLPESEKVEDETEGIDLWSD